MPFLGDEILDYGDYDYYTLHCAGKNVTIGDTVRITDKPKLDAARLAIIVGVSLVVFKAIVGVVTHSISIKGEAVHSATDVLASFVAFVAISKANAPPDRDHPFGHGKIENLSGFIEAIIIAIAGVIVAFKATNALVDPTHHVTIGPLSILVMTVSIVANLWVAQRLKYAAKSTDSPALAANNQHVLTDVYTSGAVLVGLLLTLVTGDGRIDAILGLGVAALVMLAAWNIGKSTINLLVDGRLPENEIMEIYQILNSSEDVLSFHKLRTRKSGSDRHVDVHIQLKDDLSLLAAHAITEKIESQIRATLNKTHVIIHMEPFELEISSQPVEFTPYGLAYHGRRDEKPDSD